MIINKLEFTQKISGLTQTILHKATPMDFLKLTPLTWITNFKQILNKLNGEIEINAWIPKLQQKYDVPMMEYISTKIDDTETLRIINNCQIYL